MSWGERRQSRPPEEPRGVRLKMENRGHLDDRGFTVQGMTQVLLAADSDLSTFRASDLSLKSRTCDEQPSRRAPSTRDGRSALENTGSVSVGRVDLKLHGSTCVWRE